MHASWSLGLLLLVCSAAGLVLPRTPRHCTSLSSSAPALELPDLHLTPALAKAATGLRSVPDDKLRYQQLMFLASKCPPMDPALKVDSNKVVGCLSTVHVHATLDWDSGKISYVGDADAILTKGLVSMLVGGLSGHTCEEISAVRPEFINYGKKRESEAGVRMPRMQGKAQEGGSGGGTW